MSDMQSMVDRMRGDVNTPSTEAEELIDLLMTALESGKITPDEAKEIIRNSSQSVDEMSATGGGVASGGASFTPGEGMQYAQALDKPKKRMKENLENLPDVDIRDGKTVKVGDKVYHSGEEVTITKIMNVSGKRRIVAKKKDGEIVSGIPNQYTSTPPQTEETQDKEDKLAGGKLKKNYAVDKFGFTPAPSIPNRPSTGGEQYKAFWEEDETLKENYSRFKKATRERNESDQSRTGVGIVRKKLAEVNKMMEYLATLKSDLSTAGMVNETKQTKKSLDKMTEMIKSIYIKHKKLK